jgi:hypothetical protein
VKDRIRTLVIHASGKPRWERQVVDTVSGRLGLGEVLRRAAARVPARWQGNRYLRSLVSDGYGTLSYVLDWKAAFCQAPDLEVDLCNVNDRLEYARKLRRIGDYPLVVVLHSAAGDNLDLLRRATPAFRARRGKLLLFVANEYNLMPDKIGFARDVQADYVASQLPEAAAKWLYAECTASRVLLAPAALNEAVYRAAGTERPIDIGFRGDLYGVALGDMDRTRALELFREKGPGWGLSTDIQYVRCPRAQWSEFLNCCRGIVGAESGTSYLERDDRTQQAVADFLRGRPGATFDEVFDRFFRDYRSPVSGKAISSRHFEPIGTETCQVLVEGHYNGILVADEHYIALRRDLSNVADVVARLQDEPYRARMVRRAKEYALDAHTYRHRVDALLRVVVGDGVG